MLDVLRMTLVFIVLLVFLRLKWNIGYVMLIATGLLFLLYLVRLPVIGATFRAALTDTVTIKLFLALSLIRVLEIVLREKEVMAGMMEASRELLRKRKAVIVSMPMLIGLLPSLGGAYFSAPMVEESTRGLKMSAEEKGFVNYWFRHPWEYVLPLYPGLLLATAITKVELRDLIFANTLYAVLIVITGFLFGLRGVKGGYSEEELRSGSRAGSGHEKDHGIPGPRRFDLRRFWSFLPVASVLLMVMLFHMELHFALAITVLSLFIFYRFRPGDILRVLKHGFAPDVFILILGVMLFKFAMENSGAVTHLNEYFTQEGIPLLPVLFVLPFVSGLLTGLTVGFVGSTFPLIVSLAGGAHLGQLTFAFAAGFTGVLLSPVHLCLVLTREYFKADAWGIYRRSIPAVAIVMSAALIEYLLLT